MPDPEPLSSVIGEYIARRGLARVQGTAQTTAAWRQVAGDRIAEHTRVLKINRGVLEVAVGNSALLSELVSFHQKSLLSRLQREFPDIKVRDIRFQLRTDLKSSRNQ